jgi:hypothetical protein
MDNIMKLNEFIEALSHFKSNPCLEFKVTNDRDKPNDSFRIAWAPAAKNNNYETLVDIYNWDTVTEEAKFDIQNAKVVGIIINTY